MPEATRAGRRRVVVGRVFAGVARRGKPRGRTIDRVRWPEAPWAIPSVFARVDVSTKFDGSGTSVRFSR